MYHILYTKYIIHNHPIHNHPYKDFREPNGRDIIALLKAKYTRPCNMICIV
jgi:hypothetical protein